MREKREKFIVSAGGRVEHRRSKFSLKTFHFQPFRLLAAWGSPIKGQIFILDNSGVSGFSGLFGSSGFFGSSGLLYGSLSYWVTESLD
jgi:hypothetical protein